MTDSRHQYFEGFHEEVDKIALQIIEVDGRIPSKNLISDIAFACIEMKMFLRKRPNAWPARGDENA